jgi:hypothetical protein
LLTEQDLRASDRLRIVVDDEDCGEIPMPRQAGPS